MIIVAFCLCLVAAVVGLALKDVRAHGVTLAVSLIMLVLLVTHAAVLR